MKVLSICVYLQKLKTIYTYTKQKYTIKKLTTTTKKEEKKERNRHTNERKPSICKSRMPRSIW
jgi:hypothetical protein